MVLVLEAMGCIIFIFHTVTFGYLSSQVGLWVSHAKQHYVMLLSRGAVTEYICMHIISFSITLIMVIVHIVYIYYVYCVLHLCVRVCLCVHLRVLDHGIFFSFCCWLAYCGQIVTINVVYFFNKIQGQNCNHSTLNVKRSTVAFMLHSIHFCASLSNISFMLQYYSIATMLTPHTLRL